jgi:hypothetical protein
MKHLSNLDLTGNELQNAVIQPLGTPPSGAKEGQIYFDSTAGDKKLYFYNGTQWVAIQDTDNYVDDIAFASSTGVLTLGRSGALADLTVSLDGRYLTAHPSTSPSSSVNNSGRTYIQDITLDSFGHIVGIVSATETVTDTNTTYAVGVGASGSNSSTIVLTGSDASTDSVTISGTTGEIEVTESGDQINIGLPNDVTINNDLVVGGNLTVSGSVTTVNTETILLADNIITLNSNAVGSATENAGIEVERGDDPNRQLRWNETTDRWEIQANDGNFYAIQYVNGSAPVQSVASADSSVTVTNTSGAVDLSINNGKYSYASTIGDGLSTSYTVTHNLGSRDVEVQLFDLVSYETVISDIIRTTINTITVSFTTSPTAGRIRVLVKKIG